MVMKALSEKIKQIDRDAARDAGFFLLKTAGVYAFWKVFVYAADHISFLTPHWNAFRHTLGILLAKISAFFVVDLFGYAGRAEGRALLMDGVPGIYIGNTCIGLSAMVIFTGLIAVYPGKWKHKLWFIPLGLILVQGSNLFRLVGLAIMQIYSSEAFVQFNHGYTYVIITYSFIFLLVAFWMNRLAEKA
jgi:exosortase/archaeosortase family protein